MKNTIKQSKSKIKNYSDVGMRTNIGNAFVYGELKAVDPVSIRRSRENTYMPRKSQNRYTAYKDIYS